MSCGHTAQKFWLVGCSAWMFLLALIIGLLWPSIALKFLLYPQLVLKEGSVNFDNWKETPIPIFLEINFFNWTNHEHVYNHSIKPHFAEMGPYVFAEKHIRTNLSWNDEEGKIFFYQKRLWEFVPERSNGSMDDEVTNLNVIATTVGYSSRYFNNALKIFLGLLMNQDRAPVVTTKTVRELLFEGYSDDLLTIIRANENPDIPKPPFDKFGWFVDRNDSYTYDGNFTMFTGSTDISKLGILEMWNDKNVTNLYRGLCDRVKGTTGELWPPIAEGTKPPLEVFATDICRSVLVKYDSDFSKFGINGYKWVGDDSVFDNGLKYPDNKCYCSAEESSCPDLLSGVFNASSCKFGAPAFVSFPHFYLANDFYANAVEGMKPSKDYEFSVAMEPRTGIPLEVNAQLQINLLMKPYEWIRTFKNVPEIMMPMFWFRQTASLTQDLASQAKFAVLLPNFGVWFAYGLAGLGGLGFIILGYCFIYRWRTMMNDDEELLS